MNKKQALDSNSTPHAFDQQIQAQLNVVTKILAASAKKQDTIEAAMQALKGLQKNLENGLNAHEKKVTKKSMILPIQ